ncbi:sensor domain-containing protein [Mycobacterium sp. E2497]|uniref:sensor domain-containing protein n=1 Tax=Mycobacterium sp. E2497 TaxID=1834135 RepID=UPI0009ED4195|nr:sensor domain-containing protein [Mycobacterium sp. E2497]
MNITDSFAVAATFAAITVAVGCAGGKGGGHSATPAAPTGTTTVTTTAPAPPPPPPTMAPTSIDSLILAPATVGDIVGTKFDYVAKPPPGFLSPPKPVAVVEGNPECGALYGPNTDSFGDYTAYRANSYEHDMTHPPLVNQDVAMVADAKTATQLLDTAFAKPLNSCDNAVTKNSFNMYTKWQKIDVTATDVRWTATGLKNGQVVGSVCAKEARAKNNVVIYAQVCEEGNGAPTALATIVDKISEKIPG